jgi:hypothetical protein
VDRPAVARTLTAIAPAAPPPRSRREYGRFLIAAATEEDDAEIRRMLRETAFPGHVSLSFEREPDSLAVQVEGDVHDVIVARERASGRVGAVASRSSRLRFVNGIPTRVGYLGQLRIASGISRLRELLGEGFRFCRSLHERDAAVIYLASVISDNVSARRLLERGLPDSPRFTPVGDLATMAIPARGGYSRRSSQLEIVSPYSFDPHELAAVLARNNRRYQFAPCWTADELLSRPGLGPADFLVAVRRGSIVGCAALWDQRAFKQVIVRGYSRPLARWRPLINTIGPLFGIPALPAKGSELAFAYLSHVAADDDDPDVVISLVAAGRRAARSRGLDYITLGVSTASPVYVSVCRTFPHRSYSSVLYAACWPGGEPVIKALDGRPSHPEMAIL